MPWQPANLVYPDIELVLTGRFRAALAARTEPYAQNVFVSNSIPGADQGGRRDRMVIVRRDGGTQAEMRDRPRVSLSVWAMTDQDATDLARLVLALAPSFADGNPIISVPVGSITGPTPIPDESGQPLRYIVAEFHTRGVAL
jgi:hypothetical protein